MRVTRRAGWILALVGVGIGGRAGAIQEREVTSEQVVSALEGAYGVHADERRNHTKGTCALGTFTGAPETATYSRSALFTGSALPVVARFSLAGGDPHSSDAERSPRGMALQFRLPNGGLQHMTMINTPTFFAAMPRTFLDKMLALTPDPATGKPNPETFEAFKASHPDNRGQAAFLADHNPPTSYGSSAYYGIHTFKFIAENNAVTLVKWRFVPQGGERLLTDAELTSMPRDFLEQRLIQQTQQGPLRWDMWITVGQPGDAEDDPTIAWPKDRKELKAGVLTIASAMPQPGAGCEAINYDPLVMGDGIAATKDPVLLFRSPSYGLSASKRLQGR